MSEPGWRAITTGDDAPVHDGTTRAARHGAAGDGHVAGTGGFRHEALVYDSVEDLTATAGPFLRQGLAAGDGAVLAVGPGMTGPLRDAVGHDSRVLVVDRHALYRARPTAAISSFRRLAADRAGPGRRVRVVGEVDFGTTVADWHEWQRYEAAVNEALAHCPLWGLCAFHTGLPEPILDTARHTHPRLRTRHGPTGNPDFVDPAGYLRALPVPDEPLEATPPVLAVDEITDVTRLRHAVRAQLATVPAPDGLVEDFLLAVGEVAVNAVRHGRPPAGLRLWTGPGALVCTISDAGRDWDDPFAGYGPAHGEDLSHGGMGLWLARQLCDHVAIRRTEHGSSVRLTTHWD